MEKRCGSCGAVHPATADYFPRNRSSKDGYHAHCKVCHRARYRAFYEKNRASLVAKATERVKRLRDTDPVFRAADREKSRMRKRAMLADPQRYEQHLARGRQWCKANPERVKLFKHQSSAHKAARSAVREAAKLRATPVWADRQAIAAVYAMARALTAATGIEHHVDHIVPLRGRTACGLHVHTNL